MRLDGTTGVDNISKDDAIGILTEAGFGSDIAHLSIGEPMGSSFMDTVGMWIPINIRGAVDRILTYSGDLFNAHLSQVSAVRSPGDGKPDLQAAYHGTSAKNFPSIVNRGLKTGPSTTSDKKGVYCERHSRRHSCLNYMTHSKFVALGDRQYLIGGLVEMVVDRSVGGTIHSQWVQPPGSVLLQGLVLHVININDVYSRGVSGWYGVDLDTLTAWGAPPLTEAERFDYGW